MFPAAEDCVFNIVIVGLCVQVCQHCVHAGGVGLVVGRVAGVELGVELGVSMLAVLGSSLRHCEFSSKKTVGVSVVQELFMVLICNLARPQSAHLLWAG